MFLRPWVYIFFALLAGFLTFSDSSYAQSNTSSEVKKSFSIAATAAKTRSLYDHQDGSLKESLDFEFAPSYLWSLGNTLLYMTYSEDLRAEEASDASTVSDIAIIHTFKGWNLPKINLKPGLILMIPFAKESVKVKGLQTSVAAKLAASIPEKLLIPGLSFGGAVTVGRSFHRYDTAMTGDSNNQYSSRQILMSSYSLGIFSVGVEFHHINAWTYKGTLKEAFEHFEEASVAAGDHFSFSLGHTNSGSVFKANGYESNYKLVDENNSLVYAKVSMQY